MSSKIKDILTEISTYLRSNRRVGHTTAMVEGVRNVRARVLCVSHEHADYLHEKTAVSSTATIDWVGGGGLRDIKLRGVPLVADNYTLQEICDRALRRINDLEHELEETKRSAQNFFVGLHAERAQKEALARELQINKAAAEHLHNRIKKIGELTKI